MRIWQGMNLVLSLGWKQKHGLYNPWVQEKLWWEYWPKARMQLWMMVFPRRLLWELNWVKEWVTSLARVQEDLPWGCIAGENWKTGQAQQSRMSHLGLIPNPSVKTKPKNQTSNNKQKTSRGSWFTQILAVLGWSAFLIPTNVLPMIPNRGSSGAVGERPV